MQKAAHPLNTEKFMQNNFKGSNQSRTLDWTLDDVTQPESQSPSNRN